MRHYPDITIVHFSNCVWRERRKENPKDDGLAYYEHALFCLVCEAGSTVDIKNVEYENFKAMLQSEIEET